MADPSVNPQVQRLREQIEKALMFANAVRGDGNDRQFTDAVAALDALADALEVALRERDEAVHAYEVLDGIREHSQPYDPTPDVMLHGDNWFPA